MRAQISSKERIIYKDVKLLVENSFDREEIVRIASLRASLRLATSPNLVQPDVREEIISGIVEPLRVHESEAIRGVSFIPAERLQPEIVRILDPLEKVDRDRAGAIVTSLARNVGKHRFLRKFAGESGEDKQATDLIHEPVSADIERQLDVAEKHLEPINLKLRSALVTSLFARLAASGELSEPLLKKARQIGLLVERWGNQFEPDVQSLFQIYKSFF